MNESLLELRNATYALVVGLGRAPTSTEVAAELRRTTGEVLGGWRQLHDAHALVLNGAGDELRMANPFSAVPTAYRVHCAGRWWYGNCAWDAFGIGAALSRPARVECSCPDCGEAMGWEVEGAAVEPSGALFHCLLPAARWWDDIVFT